MKKYRRFHRIKKKRKIFKSFYFWLSLFLLVLFFSGVYFLLFSDFFKIKEVEISGQNRVKKEEIENVIKENLEKKNFIFKRNNIFLVDLNKIKNEIFQKFPQVEKLRFKRDFPNKLIVNLEEKKEVAVFFRDDKFFLLDGNGIIFEKTNPEVSLPKIESSLFNNELVLGEQVIDKETLDKILKMEKKLEDLNIPLEKISIVAEDNLRFKTKEGWEIFIDPQKDIDWQITKLGVVFEKEISLEKRKNLEYIDLRFGNFAFPKYKQ